MRRSLILSFFFFNDTATTEIYTLSLHDALPIYDEFMSPLRGRDNVLLTPHVGGSTEEAQQNIGLEVAAKLDRKSTRLNSSHTVISYAVFCLKKKKKKEK